MSRITVFSCQILCRESRCFWSHILTLQKATGATKQLFSNSEIEGGHPGEVRRLRGVILEGEEIEGGHFGK